MTGFVITVYNMSHDQFVITVYNMSHDQLVITVYNMWIDNNMYPELRPAGPAHDEIYIHIDTTVEWQKSVDLDVFCGYIDFKTAPIYV